MLSKPEAIEQARTLFNDGHTPEEIGAAVGRTARTVRNWKGEFGWKRGASPEAALEAAIARLTEKEPKSAKDWKDLDRYSANLAKLRKGAGKKRERKQAGDDAPKQPDFFAYQKKFLDDNSPFRFCLKGRQTGFTWLVAWEALENALKTGRDKIFISASFRQTGMIRKYVKQHAWQYFKLKLRGTESVRLPNDAEIHFLASNADTAQGFSGDVYFDEFFWVRNAKSIFENAAAIASLRDYRITITSTPSVKSHYGYELWDPGRTPIKISRHLVTIVDAVEGGNHEVNLAKILEFFPPGAIRRLYMAEFADDAGSVFSFDEIMACVHDDDPALFEPKEGEAVWGGLDVSRFRDDTSLIFVGVQHSSGLPVFTWRDRVLMTRTPLPAQEERVKHLLAKWNPEEFAIDRTTIGEHLADVVKDELPGASLVRFDAGSKARLVINMQDIVRSKRLKIPMDQRMIDSFLAIKRKALETNVGFDSVGGEGIGHADDFWALALACYPAWGGRDNGFFCN